MIGVFVEVEKKYQRRRKPEYRELCGYVICESGCWEWVGNRNVRRGYGQLRYNGKTQRAHKVVYELANGPVPHDLELDHLCRNPACVRPDHLEAVTHKVNVLRGQSPTALNAKRTCCDNGHPYPPAGTYKNPGRWCPICRKANDRARREGRRAGTWVARRS